jgi:hypothetical protein
VYLRSTATKTTTADERIEDIEAITGAELKTFGGVLDQLGPARNGSRLDGPRPTARRAGAAATAPRARYDGLMCG